MDNDFDDLDGYGADALDVLNLPMRLAKRFRLYDIGDVRAQLQDATGDSDIPPEEWIPNHGRDSERQFCLESILKRGTESQFHMLYGPAIQAVPELQNLVARAPHFAEFGDMLITHALAAINAQWPFKMNPVLLVGGPGVGKTWTLERVAKIIGLPFRSYPMSTATLGEGLQGAHPVWRGSDMGLVARTLLFEKASNPLIFVDELDKAFAHKSEDPYRPFYRLLDKSGSRTFVDEYLCFPMDASNIVWIAAANDISELPEPIIDRLTIFHIPNPSREQRVAVIRSIYTDANADHEGYFEPSLDEDVLGTLLVLNPRNARLTIENAMTYAAADKRRVLRIGDIKLRKSKAKKKIGFLHDPQ